MVKKLTKIKTIAVALVVVMLSGSVFTACSRNPTRETTGTNEAIEETSGKISGDVSFDDYMDQVSELVKSNWPVMNKVWPGYDYTNHNYIMFNLDEEGAVKEAKLLNVNENRSLEKNEYEGITAPNPGGYDQTEFQGKPSIAMSIDDSIMKSEDPVEIYKTATHEMVHFYYQKNIKDTADSSRSQIYPVEKEPRIIRRMIYTRLIQAFEEPDKKDEYLGKAKFWLDKYNDEFKNEADSIRVIDIAEGTARYTENLGVFIGKNLSEKDFKKEEESYIRKEQIFIAADKESYEIGYVAGLVLDEKNPNWKEDFYSTGKGIQEVLLEDVTPISDEPDDEIADKVTNEVNKTNEAAKDKLKDIIEAKDNTGIPFLHLDVSKGSKSFYAEGMFNYQDLSVMTGYSSKFKVEGKSIEINNTAIISGYEMEDQYLRIPLTMKYDIKDGILTINSDRVKADGIPVQTSEENGRTIYSTAIQD